jgi:hypothetical protein
MFGDSSDKASYSIAIASIGLALAVLLAGICWIAVQHGESSPSSTDVFTLKCPLGDSVKCRPPIHLHVASATSDAAPSIPKELWAVLLVLGGVFVGALIPSPFVRRPPDFRTSNTRRQRLLDGAAAVSRLLLIVTAVGLFALAVTTSSSPSAEWTPFLCACSGFLLGLAVPSPSGRD